MDALAAAAQPSGQAASHIVILGMHRSGTSFLAQALAKAGLFVGEKLLGGDRPKYDNLTGHWEDSEIVAVNDEILQASGGAWDQPPSDLTVLPDTAERMGALIERFETHAASGWKDPRTVLTYPAWKPYLRAPQLVACFRHPLEVAQSLHTRDNLPIEKCLVLWRTYNARLLDIARREPHVHWFFYQDDRSITLAMLEQLCGRLGLQYTPEVASSFNSLLKHQAASGESLDPATAQVFDELCEMAAGQMPRAWITPSGSPTADQSRLSTAGQAADAHAADWRDLRVVLDRHNAILQELSRNVGWLGERTSYLDERTEALPNLPAEFDSSSIEERLSSLRSIANELALRCTRLEKTLRELQQTELHREVMAAAHWSALHKRDVKLRKELSRIKSWVNQIRFSFPVRLSKSIVRFCTNPASLFTRADKTKKADEGRQDAA